MDRITQESIDAMNYVIAFSNGSITEEIRNKAKPYFNSFERYHEIFNDMILLSKRRLSTPEGSLVFEDIFEMFVQEYHLLDLDNFINFDYLNDILYLSLRLSAINGYKKEMLWERINSEIECIADCDNEQLKNEIYYVCITIVSNYNITTDDLESAENLLQLCRDIDFGLFRTKILPVSIFIN